MRLWRRNGQLQYVEAAWLRNEGVQLQPLGGAVIDIVIPPLAYGLQ
jgi:hypothetical protein